MEDKIKDLELDKAFSEIKLSTEKLEGLKKSVNEKGRTKSVSNRSLPKIRYIAVAACFMLLVIIDICIYKMTGSSATEIIIQRFNDKSIAEIYDDDESVEYIYSKRQVIGDIITGEYFQCKIVDAVYDDVFNRVVYSVCITGINKEYASIENYTGKSNEEINEEIWSDFVLLNKSGNIEIFYIGGKGCKTILTSYENNDNSLCMYVEQDAGAESCIIGFKKWAGDEITARYEMDFDIFDKIESIKFAYEGTDITITPFGLSIGKTDKDLEINEMEILYDNGYVSRPIMYGYFNDIEYKELDGGGRWDSPKPDSAMFFREVRDIKNIVTIRINGQVVYRR